MDLKAKAELSKLLGGRKPNDEARGKVYKTYAMTPEWQKQWDKFSALMKQGQDQQEALHKLAHEVESLRRYFWATVEKDTKDYEHQMEIDEKNNQVISYESHKGGDEVDFPMHLLEALKKLFS